ncbi:hypothetical protein CKALI_11445 [Corynebacterium kalinowskii]|uniref:Uncharacterized protein n=1 Tax=Corynebacterium kalinowskii TaxID=2675216 RepID=A0A6B8VG69_9CORY|nr:hypothetical protein CKALI_11445 [Corynebacterium kalinowskii]
MGVHRKRSVAAALLRQGVRWLKRGKDQEGWSQRDQLRLASAINTIEKIATGRELEEKENVELVNRRHGRTAGAVGA